MKFTCKNIRIQPIIGDIGDIICMHGRSKGAIRSASNYNINKGQLNSIN